MALKSNNCNEIIFLCENYFLKFLRKIFFIFLFLINGLLAANAQQKGYSAQNIFKIDSSQITSFHFNAVDESKPIDTSLNDVHLYHPAQNDKYPFYFDLGNLGQPVYQFYQFKNVPFGFNANVDALEPMRFHFDDRLFYNTYQKAYSDLYYVVGLKSENLLQAVHSQNFTKNIHFDGNYRYVNSEGFYQRQTTINHNLFLSTTFVTNNERFHSQVGYMLNRFSFQQNGGTTNDSIYENSYINKNVVPINLAAAYTKIKEDSWQFANSYDFGKNYNRKINDTTTLHHYVPFFRVQYLLRIDNQYRRSGDAQFDSINYLPLHVYEPLKDTFGTKDSLVSNLVLHTYSNTFLWQTMPFKNIIGDSLILRKTLCEAGFEHQTIQVRSSGMNFSDYNFNLQAKIKNNDFLKSNLKYNLALQYCVAGYNQGNYKLNGGVKINFLQSNWLGCDAAAQKYHTYLQTLLWSFENFEPQSINNSQQTQLQTFEAWWANAKHHFKISFSNTVLQHYQYFDANATLQTSYRTITQPYLQLQKDVVFHNWHFKNLLLYNFIQNTEIPMPTVFYKAQLYYQNYMFSKAMFAQLGFQFNFQDKYFAPQWMPVYDYFYAQHQTLFGSQQNVQVFINVKIKHAMLFAKVDNLLQGLDGHGFYVGKGYPLPDRSFKFGVSWRFFDE